MLGPPTFVFCASGEVCGHRDRPWRQDGLVSPATALVDARQLLVRVGYAEDDLVSDYRVWSGGQQFRIADLVAFAGRGPKDMSTAAVTVSASDGDVALTAAFDVAATLATPFVLSRSVAGLDLWLARPNGPTRWGTVEDADSSDLAQILRPSSALDIKVGLRQQGLFDIPVNLLAFARARGAERLSPIVVEALLEASDRLPSSQAQDPLVRSRRDHQRAARLVVGALTTLVVRDRNSWRTTEPDALVRRVARGFGKTFSWLDAASLSERNVLNSLVQQLGTGIDYRSLDASVLSHVYEDALVSEDERRKLGIHYTPPRLATRLLSELPVELVEPGERHVLDPACGSGSLLIAAHDRLRDLQPPDWTSAQRHSDLRVHVRGFDIDPFAVEIARLSLLLHAQPAGNGWNVDARNTLTTSFDGRSPSLIVSNPPWKYVANEGRFQAADDFVNWSVDHLAPGGLLGVLVPQSWLSTGHSRDVRDKLVANCDVFELWRLPEQTFATSSIGTAVLLARKRDGLGGRGRRVVRDVPASRLSAFLDGAPAPANFLIAESEHPNLAANVPKPSTKKGVTRLAEVADIRSGPQPKRDIRSRDKGDLFLRHFGDVDSYGAVPTDGLWHVQFPDDFQTGRGAAINDRRKVLVSAARARSPWQLKVAIDLNGVIVSNSTRGVAPKDGDDEDMLFALLMLLGSGFANTFVAARGGDRNVSAGAIADLPIPTDRRAIRRLAQVGRRVVAAPRNERARIVGDAEDIVWAAYGVLDSDRTVFVDRLRGFAAPEGRVRYPGEFGPPELGPDTHRRVGTVLNVTDQSLVLWVNGITSSEGVHLPVPPRMPGWMVRPGATFDVWGVKVIDDLYGARYRFQRESWRDPDLDGDEPVAITAR